MAVGPVTLVQGEQGAAVCPVFAGTAESSRSPCRLEPWQTAQHFKI